jgi:hypothetical protein
MLWTSGAGQLPAFVQLRIRIRDHFFKETGSLGRTRLVYREANEKWPPAMLNSFPVKKSFIFICWNTNETLL